MEREFKYYREDFAKLSVIVNHMDLYFDVYEDHVDAVSSLKVTTKENISSLSLNAHDLELHEVSCHGHEMSYEYDTKNNLINITFEKSIEKDVELVIHTKSTCKPTSHILEGIYYDETPKCCPKTMITQCQQWGFQRIVPCIDDMSAKCTYITTICGDKRYTNIFTNGDLASDVQDIGNDRVKVVYNNTLTPMATYLFFLGLGTYATFTREFTYPDGDTFMLELLVPPQSDKEIAQQSLDILHDAIMWVHLFTGPDTYENKEKSQQVWDLMKEGKFSEAKELSSSMKFGYKYTGKVYREIGMQNSNFGGMENVGNTTITANRIMPYPYMSDNGFIYMTRVKAHEYYHNLNGSEVTGATPFEFWLNEAVTVFIEQKYAAYMYGEEFERLSELHYITDPQQGVMAMDRSPAAMPIEPIGFNNPDELVDSITYVKSPEVVRMVETIIGKEVFVKALDLYHTRYKHSNATSDQWFACMKEVSGVDLSQMLASWIRQKGHPTITVTVDNGKMKLVQSQYKKLYMFPFVYAVYDKEGKLVKEDMVVITEEETEITIGEFGFLSLNRDFSAFIDLIYEQSEEELYLQVKHDADLFNKNMALDKLFAKERLRLLQDKDAAMNEELVEVYVDLLFDKDLQQRVGVSHIAISDLVEKEFLHKYQDLYEVRGRMFLPIAKKYEDKLLAAYTELKNKTYSGSIVEQRIASIKDRSVKNTCLGLLSRLDTPQIQSMIKEQFLNSVNASDKLSAFRMYLKSSANDRAQLIDDYEIEARKNLVTWEGFLVGVAGNEADDALDFVKRVEQSDSFRIDQANDQRGLFAVFCGNLRKSLLTEEGRDYLKHVGLVLSPVNQYNALEALNSLDSLNHVDNEHQVKLVELMVELLNTLTEVPMVTSYLKRTLKGSPDAIASYEKEHGSLDLKYLN